MKKTELVIFVVIILSIFHIFIEEVGIILQWPIHVRHLLIWIGFVIDLIFTIEFATRFIIALKNKESYKYLFSQGGWIDFFASIPLLLFYSGIRVYYLSTISSPVIFYQSSLIALLRVFKMIRLVRILRFMRIVKLFGNLFQAKMENIRKNIFAVTSIAIGSMIIAFFVMKILFHLLNWPDVEVFKEKRVIQYRNMVILAENLSQKYGTKLEKQLLIIFKSENNVLSISVNNEKIFSVYTDEELFKKYDVDDLMIMEKDHVNILFNTIDINKQIAKNNIEFLVLILAIVLGLFFFYIPYYERQIMAKLI
ncbi:MAG: hypothetical protein JW827_10125 [Spirochaetes bacterium]|nr:hypothetical protein [Spirochaetota bacterium]